MAKFRFVHLFSDQNFLTSGSFLHFPLIVGGLCLAGIMAWDHTLPHLHNILVKHIRTHNFLK